MEQEIRKLTKEKFKEIYTNEKLRNEVAYAHGVADSGGKLLYMKALMYPIAYKVTEKQIKEAQALIDKRQKEVLKENKYNLLFCGMGMEFKPTFEDGIGNHRIRTEFKNAKGKVCFIEVGTGYTKEGCLRIDHALFNYDEKKKEIANYKELERNTPELKYTYANVLNLVNTYFNCHFKKMVVDYYNISCDVTLCESPKEAI